MKREVLGWYLITAAKSFIIVPFVFAGPQFLNVVKNDGVAQLAADTNQTIEDVTRMLNETDGRVLVTLFGGLQLDASSVLVLTSTVASVVVMLTAPLAGAIVDYTVYRRRQIAIAYATGAIAILLFLLGLVLNQWRISFLCGPFIVTAMDVGNVGYFAYLPEFAIDEDEGSVSDYAARAAMILNGIQVIFLVLLAGAGMFLGVDEFDLTVVALGLGAGGVLMLSMSGISLLNPRPALHELEKGQNILVASIGQLLSTLKLMFTDYHQVFKFLIGYTFLSALLTTLVTLSSTYLSEELKLGSTQVSIFFLISIISGIPGAYTVERAVRYVHARTVALIGMGLWLVSLAITPIVVHNAPEAYFFGALWGYLLGLTYTSARVLYTVIIPGGQEAEMMGVFEFTSKLLGWSPGIVFTAVNESTRSLRVALGTVSVFVLPAMLAVFMLDLEKADNDIRATLRRRFHSDDSLRAPGVRESMTADVDFDKDSEVVEVIAEKDNEVVEGAADKR